MCRQLQMWWRLDALLPVVRILILIFHSRVMVLVGFLDFEK